MPTYHNVPNNYDLPHAIDAFNSRLTTMFQGLTQENYQPGSVNGGETGAIGQETVEGQNIAPETIGIGNLSQDLLQSLFFDLNGHAVYIQDDEPTGGTYAVDDYWFDKNDSYKVYRYNGAAWELMPVNSPVYNATIMLASFLAAGLITADMIQAGTIQAAIAIAAILLVGGSGSGTDGVIQIKDVNDYIAIAINKNGQIINIPAPAVGSFETAVPFMVHDDLVDEDILTMIDSQVNGAVGFPDVAEAKIQLLSKTFTGTAYRNIYGGQGIMFQHLTSGGAVDYSALITLKSSGVLQISGDQIVTDANVPLGAWTDWSPTITGFSSDPADGVYTYTKVGKTCTLCIRQPTSGTSNATTFTISLPFTAATRTNMVWSAPGRVVNSGSVQATPGILLIASGGTVVNVYKDYAAAAFTASGNKNLASATIVYETE
jgi:hypothetical protein